jgi:hypothetical protein
LAFSTTDLGAYAQGLITATAADRTYSADKILAAPAGPTVPVPSGGTGNPIDDGNIATFVTALTKAVSAYTFEFFMTGLGVTHTRVSCWQNPTIDSTNDYTFLPTTGQVITWADLVAANVGIKAVIDANLPAIAQQFTYCHSSCHTNCHASRGRR